jgi:hypothetical protein
MAEKKRPSYWGPKVPEDFGKFNSAAKRATLKNTLSDLRSYQREMYKDDEVLGIKGKNPVRLDRANSTLKRTTDYSKTLGRLDAADARKKRNAAKAAALKANK